MASLDFEAEKNVFREYYNNNYRFLKDAEELFRSLISVLLSGRGDMESPTVISRLKDREECINKFGRKYQSHLEAEGQEYEIKNYITDLIGIRVICLYETDISIIKNLIEDNFQVIQVTDKIADLESKEDAFGYKGLHMDISINELRKDLPEYQNYNDLKFEVQIRTIIQDAWSVLDHKIKYKKAVPTNLKRQINRLAALFELSDGEFLRVREETEELRKEAEKKREIKTEPIIETLDVFQFLNIVKDVWDKYDFYNFKADGFVQEVIKINPKLTAEDFENALKGNIDIVSEYARWLSDKTFHYMNPFTQIRHALYLYDKELFKLLLFDMQRHNFEKWILDNVYTEETSGSQED